jgi:hypothetical protein
MMMIAPIVVALSVYAATVDQACVDARVRADCAKVGEVGSLEELDRLLERPAESAACLIRQLHIVQRPVLKPDSRERLRDDFRVIWSLRALHYITHGKNFLAPPGPGPLIGKRRHFLQIRSKAEVPFFAVWMSNDTIYVAPVAAQRAIIDKWRAWYQAEGQSYDYRKADSYDDWYF